MFYVLKNSTIIPVYFLLREEKKTPCNWSNEKRKLIYLINYILFVLPKRAIDKNQSLNSWLIMRP